MSEARSQNRVFFPELPESRFMVYDGSISWEEPGSYASYRPDIEGIRLLVLKYGTSVVSHKRNERTRIVISNIARETSAAMDKFGKRVVVITSGAVHQGNKEMKRLRLTETDAATALEKRRRAGIGQAVLMGLYRQYFGGYGRGVAQVLLTHKDWDDEETRRNLMDVVNGYLDEGIVPIINEDDIRSSEEIEDEQRWFRDNDGLWSLTTRYLNQEPEYRGQVMGAIFTDQRGIRPKSYFEGGKPGTIEGRVIRVVKDSSGLEGEIPEGMEGNGKGRGGMPSKIDACREVAGNGIPCLVAAGLYDRLDRAAHPFRPIKAILESRCIGTRFLPAEA